MSNKTDTKSQSGHTVLADGIVYFWTTEDADVEGSSRCELSQERNAHIPEYARRATGSYDNRGDWAIMATFFPECFDGEAVGIARESLKIHHPDIHKRLSNG